MRQFFGAEIEPLNTETTQVQSIQKTFSTYSIRTKANSLFGIESLMVSNHKSLRGFIAFCVLLITASSLLVQTALAQSKTVTQIPQVQRIDELIERTWNEYQLKPSAPATDAEWCRRVYLDVIGRIPTVEELENFLSDKSKSKREELIDTLINSDDYVEEFARNWTTIWTNLLIGRTGGTENNSLISREGMQKFLRDSFAREKPYDRMVSDLVTATGTPAPEMEDFNGATNFLIMKVNEEDAALATAATTKLFLGLQVQCTQCHNHPFNEWKQQKYWEMNAFFRQTRTLRNGPGGLPRLVNQDFAGESRNPEEADLFFELRNGLVKVAYPVFVDGTEISKSGYLEDVNRRQELANLMMKSEYLEKTAVNRMWGHFLGYGFTKPVDDLGPHNIPSHPELLEYLASEFRQADFDMRALIKWITLSRAYSLSSKMTADNQSDDPLLGETPKFSHFYLRQMRAEELYESLLVASEAAENRGSYEEQERIKSQWLQQFASAFGTDEGDETTTFNGTIPQVLMMFNGDMIKAATSKDRQGLVMEIAANKKLDFDEKIDYLFKAGLSRKASSNEQKLAQQILAARNGNLLDGLQDMWWVILNSNEFIFNH